MFVVQISLLVVTFLSLMSRIFVINANHQRSQPTTSHCTMWICGVPPSYSYSSSSSYATCWMLVHAYATSPGKAKWSGPHHNIRMLHFVLLHSVTCYTDSVVSRMHVNTTKLRNITCILVATGVKLRGLECTKHFEMGRSRHFKSVPRAIVVTCDNF